MHALHISVLNLGTIARVTKRHVTHLLYKLLKWP